MTIIVKTIFLCDAIAPGAAYRPVYLHSRARANIITPERGRHRYNNNEYRTIKMQNSSRRPWPLLSRRRRGSNRRRRGSIVFDRFVFLCERFFFFVAFLDNISFVDAAVYGNVAATRTRADGETTATKKIKHYRRVRIILYRRAGNFLI